MTALSTAGTGVNRLGASSANLTSIAAGVATQLFTAAQNVNGAWVRTATLVAGAAAQGMSLVSGAAAPTTTTSNPTILLAIGIVAQTLQAPVFVPAGQGLWTFNQAAGGIHMVTWDLM